MRDVELQTISSNIWFLMLYIGIGATAAPYLLNAWALARVDPSTVAIFVYLQPLIGFLLAVVFLGEAIDTKFALAAILIFIGVFLTSRQPQFMKPDPELSV
jgi:drug/metabolite transporter (DMT)-like permease